jgi:hypothetical protein
MHDTNVEKSQRKVGIVSSLSTALVNNKLSPCPFMPTNGANFILYLFVLYVVSKLSTSPNLSYHLLLAPYDQNKFFHL